jgi:hypothetical protein
MNISKMRGRASAGMPIPVSRTEMTTSSPSTDAPTQILPPRSMYFAALFNRFARICERRVGSPSRRIGSDGRFRISS